MGDSDRSSVALAARNGELIAPKALPQHLAIIMDGNGRWARKRFLPRAEGHRQGSRAVRMVVEESRRLGIRYLTLFAFSTENWQRPAEEVSALMRLFHSYLESELQLLLENDIRLRAIGDRSRLPAAIRELLERNEALTAQNTGMDLILAISYGGRDEIVHAAKALAREVQSGKLDVDQVGEAEFAARLFTNGIPDPDMLIRSSDEFRISNFLLWQLAYAELVVSPVLWPDFSKEEFFRCLHVFAGRNRRFGRTAEQVNDSCVEAAL